MRAEPDIIHTINAHGDTLWRVCVLTSNQQADAQDAFQETLLRYAMSTTAFNDEEHRKAWLIKVATNVCKDMLKAAHQKTISLDGACETNTSLEPKTKENPDETFRAVLEAIRALTDPPRTPVYLALYEGYTAPEIAEILDAPVNTVYSWIARGKKQLREALK